MRKIAPIAIAFLLVACGGDSEKSASDTPSNGQPAAGQMANGQTMTAAEPLTGDPSHVCAKVGSDEITLREVDLLANTLRGNRPGAGMAELQKIALDNLIDQRVLVRTAHEKGISPTDEDFQAAVSQITSQFPSEEAFTQALQQQGMTREDFDQNFRTELTIQKLVEEVFADTAQVTEAEARAYYDSNPQEFQTPETVHARHILIRVDPNATPETDAAAKGRAQMVLDRIRGGEDFVAVADEVTEDPSGKGRGGDLGFFPRERMVPPFSEAAFALEAGKVSDLVKTQFGYHIIKTEEKRPAGKIDFAEIEDRLIQNLTQRDISNGIRAYLDAEKAKMGIEREI
ncbi:MAG: peptidylprolyl isomerase [Candidatus Eisenbacteria bacterium]